MSSTRVATELGIPHWKANEVCWALERVFYAPGQVNYRVTRRSFDAFLGLIDMGASIYEARAVLATFGRQDRLPPAEITLEKVRAIARRWRWGY